MNRLQKKCLLGSAVMHGAVALTLLLTTAFSGPKVDDEYVPVMTMVDTATLTDGKSTGGSPEAQSPAQTPAPPQPALQQIQPPVSRPPEEKPPAVTPPPKPVEPIPVARRETPPVPEPEPEIVLPKPEKLRADVAAELPVKPDPKKKTVVLNPIDRNPKKAAPKTAPVRPPVDLGQVVKRDTNKAAEEKARAEKLAAQAAEAAAQRQADQRRTALANAVRGAGTAVQVGTGSKTSIELVGGPGGGGPAALNYDQYIVAEFTRNWNLPSTLRDDSLTVKARVTISSDGRVVSASISSRSGDSALDRSVESVLQRVKQVRGFPSGVSSENRTYTIKFKPEFNLGSG